MLWMKRISRHLPAKYRVCCEPKWKAVSSWFGQNLCSCFCSLYFWVEDLFCYYSSWLYGTIKHSKGIWGITWLTRIYIHLHVKCFVNFFHTVNYIYSWKSYSMAWESILTGWYSSLLQWMAGVFACRRGNHSNRRGFLWPVMGRHSAWRATSNNVVQWQNLPLEFARRPRCIAEPLHRPCLLVLYHVGFVWLCFVISFHFTYCMFCSKPQACKVHCTDWRYATITN